MHQRNDEFTRLLQGSGWSDARAAREIGIHPTVIWKYRTGAAVPKVTVLRLLAGLTNQQITLEGEDPIRFNDGPRLLAPWEERIVSTLRRLESEPRQRVVESIVQMVEAMAHPVRYAPPRRPDPDPIPTTEQLIHAAVDAVTLPQGSSPLSSAVSPPAGDRPRSDVSTESPPSSMPRRGRKPGR